MYITIEKQPKYVIMYDIEQNDHLYELQPKIWCMTIPTKLKKKRKRKTVQDKHKYIYRLLHQKMSITIHLSRLKN